MTDLKRAKFFQILDALWDPNIHLANDCYLELLITHLSGGKAGEKSGKYAGVCVSLLYRRTIRNDIIY